MNHVPCLLYLIRALRHGPLKCTHTDHHDKLHYNQIEKQIHGFKQTFHF